MKKLMTHVVIIASALLLSQGFANAQGEDDTELLKKVGKSESVQEDLANPDGVAIRSFPDGSFQIFSRGTGTYDFNDPDDIRDATQQASLRAKAHIAKFLKEDLTSDEGMANATEKIKECSKNGTTKTAKVSKKSVSKMGEMITSHSKALLTGVITISTQKIPSGDDDGEIQVTLGVSTKTLKAVAKLGQGMNKALADQQKMPEEDAGEQEAQQVPSRPNKGWKRTNNSDF